MHVIKPIKFFIIGTLVAWCVCAACIAIAGLAVRPVKSDVAIVLGNAVHRDGTLSLRLRARVDTAYACFTQQTCSIIFVSGGIDANGTDEAAAMKNYLVQRGVPQEKIVTDNQGRNTLATALNAADYMRKNHLVRALAVSQFFHLPRTMLGLEHAGIQEVHGAYPDFFEMRDIYSVFREVPALIVLAIKQSVADGR